MIPVHDDVYAAPMRSVGDFRFDQQVADVFEDMIARSVPGYGTVLAMIPTLAKRYAKSNTDIYDLGCSLGACSLAVARSGVSAIHIRAIDSSAAMIDRLRKMIADDPLLTSVIQPIQADICGLAVEAASMVMMNYTLQFIDVSRRGRLLASIYDGMIPGGALLMSEKVSWESESQQSVVTALHHDFKRAQGYSDLEIAQKRTALENTLIPETIETHLRRLAEAGFETAIPWFSCLGFVSFLAVKAERPVG